MQTQNAANDINFAEKLVLLLSIADYKIDSDTDCIGLTYDLHTRHLRDDRTPKIASFRPSKVSDY